MEWQNFLSDILDPPKYPKHSTNLFPLFFNLPDKFSFAYQAWKTEFYCKLVIVTFLVFFTFPSIPTYLDMQKSPADLQETPSRLNRIKQRSFHMTHFLNSAGVKRTDWQTHEPSDARDVHTRALSCLVTPNGTSCLRTMKCRRVKAQDVNVIIIIRPRTTSRPLSPS